MASEPLIRVTGLRKTFGNHRVLDGLDLDVRTGEAVAVLGANGAGKTTLLKVLATLVRPTRGRVIVAGRDRSEERRVGKECRSRRAPVRERKKSRETSVKRM